MLFSSYNSVCGAQKAIVWIPHLNDKCGRAGRVALHSLPSACQGQGTPVPMPSLASAGRFSPERTRGESRGGMPGGGAEEAGLGLFLLYSDNTPLSLSYLQVFIGQLKRFLYLRRA